MQNIDCMQKKEKKKKQLTSTSNLFSINGRHQFIQAIKNSSLHRYVTTLTNSDTIHVYTGL